MDALTLLRTLGALGVVLGALVGGLWLVRRINPGLGVARTSLGPRRVEVVERTAIDNRRSVLLIRRDGREHLLLVGPEGSTVVESAIVQDARDRQVEEARRAEVEAQRTEAEERMRQAQARAAAAMRAANSQARSLWRRIRVTGKRRSRPLKRYIGGRRRAVSTEGFGATLARISARL